MPRESQLSVSIRRETWEEVQAAFKAGKLKRYAVRSPTHAVELGVIRLLDEVNQPPVS
jgi:hypothetical protein